MNKRDETLEKIREKLLVHMNEVAADEIMSLIDSVACDAWG